jgi:hypothetical protein
MAMTDPSHSNPRREAIQPVIDELAGLRIGDDKDGYTQEAVIKRYPDHVRPFYVDMLSDCLRALATQGWELVHREHNPVPSWMRSEGMYGDMCGGLGAYDEDYPLYRITTKRDNRG